MKNLPWTLGFTTSGDSAALLHLLPLFCVSCKCHVVDVVLVILLWTTHTTQRSRVQVSIQVYLDSVDNWMVGQSLWSHSHTHFTSWTDRLQVAMERREQDSHCVGDFSPDTC